MRLIDADALASKAKTIYMEHANVAVPTRVIPISELHLAPTIDAEPVRHGQWIEDGPRWVCSYCGTEFNDEIEFLEGYGDYYMPHYCPHCGAKMDLEEEKHD